MFAFGLYDKQEHTLFLARDAFGIKPLFYSQGSDEFHFASELPALLELVDRSKAIDVQAAYDYLVFGRYDFGSRTFISGVEQLLPGHWMQVDLRTGEAGKPHRWWWPSIHERKDLSFDEAATQLRELFLKSVRLHLRSDVPLGAALSGGLDSSAVVCAMRHLEPDMPIHTFSYVARGTEIDEERWVDIVNNHVGAIAHKVVIAPEDLTADVDDMIRAQGEPFGSTSIYAQYRVFKAAKEAGITVTLDGQGADELLAGYHGYPSGYIRSLLDKGQYGQLLKFILSWSTWPGRSIRLALLHIGMIVTPHWARHIAYHLVGQSSSPPWLNSKYVASKGVTVSPPKLPTHSPEGQGRRLVEQLREALTGNGLQSLLRHGDRNSMRWSIESRVPFLTTELAEFLLTLPESFLLSPQGETKHIFRAAMRGIVPDAILDRKDKIGFETPERVWLSGHQPEISNWLQSAREIPFLNHSEVDKFVTASLTGRIRFSHSAWALINYCRWWQLQ
jgi:asparagine synthase (glutamine-hydrolysing)